MLLITGAAGFIGSCFTRSHSAGEQALCLVDKLTYAGNLSAIAEPLQHRGTHFAQLDIADEPAIYDLLQLHQPTAIIHFAAETHVDRSIAAPALFAQTNVLGTVQLLTAALRYWQELDANRRAQFRFLHVSTDEVYGELGPEGSFCESSQYAPNSPYAASKAAADHFVHAFHHTYGLPTLITHNSNAYGPFQYADKFIPLLITNALSNRPLPIYGDGRQVRDWLHVEDHCTALSAVLKFGCPGEVYNIGGGEQRTNLQVAQTICVSLAELTNRPAAELLRLIVHVADRPGHDRRYAIDSTKTRTQFNWSPTRSFEQGIRDTVQWFLEVSPPST